MASIIDSLLPQLALERVAIFTADFTQVFRQARAIKVSVKEDSKVMEHPVETGATIADHVIVLPVELEIALILNSVDYPSVYENIKQLRANATLLTVQTKSGLYTNQLIAALPHEEDPAQYSAITLTLKLKEVLFSTAQYNVVPRRPKDTTTVDKGQQPAPIVPNNGSVISDLTGIK